MEIVVAAFDVDGTVTVRDCVVPFMRRVAGRAGLVRAFVSSPVTVARLVTARDRDGLKEHVVSRVFRGTPVDEVLEEGVRFAAEVASGWIRADVAERMRWHQSMGHVVVFVSASLHPYLEPLGDLCEVDAVVCTTLESDGDVFTGGLVGNNCRGPEKVARLREWMTVAGIPHDALKYAYGDSSGDTELLAAAGTGLHVRRDEITAVPA